MTDTRCPDRWLTDRRIQRLTPAGFRLFFNAMMWSVSNRTDGVLEHGDLPMIPGYSPGLEDELVTVGLWAETKDGWEVLPGGEFLDTQTSRAEHEVLAKARAGNRVRQARFRAKKADETARNVTDNVTRNATDNVNVTATTQDRTGQEFLNGTPVLTVVKEPTGNSPSSEAKSLRKSGTAPARTRGTRLPEGWEPPDEVIRAMHAELPTLDLRAQHRKFTDHFRGAPGQKGVKVDWPATWRNWMRTANERGESQVTHNGHPIGRASEKAMGWDALAVPPQDRSPRKEIE